MKSIIYNIGITLFAAIVLIIIYKIANMLLGLATTYENLATIFYAFIGILLTHYLFKCYK